MTALALPALGHCRCGAIEFRVSAPPLLTMACHCRGCQRMSASAFSLSAAFPAPAFELTRGEPVIGGLRNPELRHYFCPACMSWLYTRFLPTFVNVRATMLDETAWCAPYVETWTRARLPWAQTGAAHHFDEFPTMDEFQSLIGAFQRDWARA
ncbi:MAG: GFA family protein [Proteobacteria bacterium]|nr:GFA family protein [Pseudomonadota bacterium]